LVWWSISIKLWWYVGVFTLNFGGLLKYSTIPAKFNGNTPTYHQSLMEILHHTTKPPKFNVNTPTYHFTLNFGGMLEYFH
jgi:hypothetical protein